MEIAGHIANRLAEGTITLAQATDQLEPQLAERTGFDAVWRHTYRVDTFRQGVARYVMNRVAPLLEDDPDRRAAVTARLAAEYAALK